MKGMITRSEIRAAVLAMEGRKDTPPPETNEFREPIDPMEVARRWVGAVCKFYMDGMLISWIAQQSDCDEGLVERALEEHLESYLEVYPDE